MTRTQTRFLLFLALAALLAIFAGCKAESPTAPPSVGNGGQTGGSGNPPGGGVTPPVGAAVTLTVSNPNPLIDSVTTITATVTQNGQPVTNGTAVEFVTNLGTFTDVNDVRTIRTTTNGVATTILTSSTAGVATVNATVNNVTKSIQVTFSEQQVIPPPPSTAPSISTVNPTTGPPTGGTVLTVTGANFRAPIRVVFDAGPAGTKEGFVNQASITPTSFQVVTPPINLVSTQTQAANLTVIVDAGNPTEARVTKTAAFTYVTTNLTPVIRAISPTSGPIDGGTRVTIIGDAFESPAQVFFGAAQAQIISINFNQIIVIAPTARDTAANGSGAVTGPVDVKVLNVNSGKSVVATGGFRYTPKMQVTLLGPNQGPFTGGTRFTIDGTGFNEPLTVVLAGVAATIIKVTGTQIIGISNAVVPTGCSDVTGPSVVTNGDNGDQAQGPNWIYRVTKPVVVGVSGAASPGNSVGIIVANAIDPTRIEIGGKAAQITAETHNADGTTTFTVIVPPTLTLGTQSCGGTTVKIPSSFDIKVTSLLSTCTDTSTGGLTLNPPAGPILTVTGSLVPFVGTIVPPVPPAVSPTVTVNPASQTLTIVNSGFNPTGGTPLTVNSVSGAGGGGTGCTRFAISVTPNPPANLDVCDTMPVTVTYNAPVAPTATPDVCTLTINTNAGIKTFTLTGTSQ
jgi:hypothetical protein